MAEKDSHLSDLYAGKQVDTSKMAEKGWWDRFDSDDYKLHFQYKKNRISQITIMSPAAAQ